MLEELKNIQNQVYSIKDHLIKEEKFRSRSMSINHLLSDVTDTLEQAMYQINELIINTKNFYPISLKRKTLEELIVELQRKKISLIIDCRRPNSRTAKWFRTDYLSNLLPKAGIKYIIAHPLANDKFYTFEGEFLTEKKDIIKEFKHEKKFYFENHKNIGLVCYCPEKEQNNNNCHCSWLAKKFNVLINS